MADDDTTPDDPPEGEIPLGGTPAGPGADAASSADSDSEQDPDSDTPAAAGDQGRFGTRERAVVGVALLALLGVLGWFVFGNSDEPVPEPTPTTTTTTAPTTTEAPEVRSALLTQVATVKDGLEEVVVWKAPPKEWSDLEPVVTWEAPAVPASQAEFPDRPALPRPEYPLQGRYTTPVGWRFSSPTAFGDPFSVVVTEQRGDWAEVMIPVRPNGTRGYVELSNFDLSERDYRVELDVSDRHLTAYKGTEKIADTTVVVGRDATRTPTGRFYITDKTDKANPNGFYGPHVLPLNAYSEQLDTFEGGAPVIAMHGTSRPDLLGQAASNGCIRIPNAVISRLNAELPIGTQVVIRA